MNEIIDHETGEILTQESLALSLLNRSTPTSLNLPDGLTFTEWLENGKTLRRMGRGVQWWIGDWLVYGESNYPPEDYASAVAELFDYEDPISVRQLKRVSKSVMVPLRNPRLSWSHHYEIADHALSDEDRIELLSQAEQEELTEMAFRRVVGKFKKHKRIAHLPEPKPWNGTVELDTVNLCDIADIELDRASIDMIFTDPPYDKGSLPLFESLGRLAAHALKPGAYLMTYTGHMFMPDAIKILETHLEWVWCCGVFEPDSNHQIFKNHIYQAWRPVLCFKKSGDTETCEWQPDMVYGTRDKSLHDWQQQMEPALKWIGAYTLPGQVVLDPFVGSGTTIAACRQLDRHYLAFDKDPDAIRTARERLNGKH